MVKPTLALIVDRDWNQAYLDGQTPWDHGEPAPPLLEYLQTKPRLPQNILVPGCGTGHDVRALADYGCKPVGLDIAEAAIRQAESYPPAGEESYQTGDFLNLPPNLESRFDMVFEHTCLCALEPHRILCYATACARALRSQGLLLGIFFLHIGERDPEGPPYPIDETTIDDVFAPYFKTEKKWEPKRVFPSREDGREQMRLLRRH